MGQIFPMTDPLRDAITQYLQRSGESMRSLSLRTGKSDKLVQQILKDPQANPRGDTLVALAGAMGVPVKELMGQPEAPEPVPEPLTAEPGNARVALDVPRLPFRGELPRDVPVMGTAAGSEGDGAFEMNVGDVVDYVLRGPGIANAKQVFALYVEGESMVPWRQPGGIVHVDPARKIAIGNHVLVVVDGPYPGDPPQSYIKKLNRRSGDTLLLSQYNPAKELSFDARRVKKILRILEWEEVMGW
jgi:phage repressor protein C with HTH and peptisase S24 domain